MDRWRRGGLAMVAVALLGLTACTGGSGHAGTSGSGSGSSTTRSSAPAAFGGLAAGVPVGSGRVGGDWWVRAPTTPSAVASGAKAAVLADQRYRVLAAWIGGRNAIAGHLSTAAVIDALADGAGRDYLASLPPPVSPLNQSKIYGQTRWTIIGAATRNASGYGVTTCEADYGPGGTPSRSGLRIALQAGISASTDLVVNESGTWLVLTPARSALPAIPSGCAAWAAGLRRQAGLSK